MKNFRLTVKGESGSISYDVFKTERGAFGVGKRVAQEAFYGEECEVIVEEV